MTDGKEKERRGLLRRIAGYGGRRLGSGAARASIRAGIRENYATVRSQFRIKSTSLAELGMGYRGRHKDGGKARFAKAMQEAGLDATALDTMAERHGRTSLAFHAGAVLFLVLGLVVILRADSLSGVAYGAGTASVSLVFAVMGMRAGYSRWVILNRRFGGLGEYLSGRGTGH